MDIPASETVAQEHIAQIRKSKGLDGPETNTSDLENALIILSEQLYQKSTHFLLELIQNADDNTYQVEEPTLNLTYVGRTLRLDCNEIGFGKRNVEAICKIGRSTKAGIGNATRYIGEKGIGFKSVFKVSDMVWITSGHYSFKFDKKETLGMIAPIWEKFPLPILPGYTSIFLQLSRDYRPKELISEIKSFDPRLLIFLRKLRQVNLKSSDERGKVWKTTLRRHDVSSGPNGDNVIELWHNAASSSLKSTHFQVNGFSPEPKRPGCSHSEILLAFPITRGGEPWIQSQNVYAFLPIRDYGFKFLLQADFLLIASREDIDSSSPWNQTILDAVPKAFLEAVTECNKGDLRYTWMRYIPSRAPISDFFEGLEASILTLLAESPVIENFAGDLTPPSKLRIVPADFTDDNGVPLICTSHTFSTYVSQTYSVEDTPVLNRLGVQIVSAREFLADLKSLLLKNPRAFREMPSGWHARLANALTRTIYDDEDVRATVLSTVSELEIVHLRDGRWVSPNQDNLCFPNDSHSIKVPKGLKIHEIHPQTANDHFQRTLYTLLGAKSFSKDLVCDIIVGIHEAPESGHNDLSVDDLIGHIIFLYRTNWKNNRNHDLWFATQSGSICRGSEIYLDTMASELYSATSLFNIARQKFSFLHSSYVKAFSDADSLSADSDWASWLVRNCHLAEYPRLVEHAINPKPVLSQDFQFLLDAGLQKQILLLFREHWGIYAKFLHPENSSVEGTDLVERLSTMRVTCCGGGEAPLNQTILPLGDIAQANVASVLFLDIPEPEDTRWRFLRSFGVIVEMGPEPFIQCLRQLKLSKTSIEEVSGLYKQIQGQSSRHGEKIRSAFRAESLVYIPSVDLEGQENWTDVNICVWDGPKCLRKTPCLKDFYSGHHQLIQFFYVTLGIPNASWKTLMEEAQHIEASDNIEYISAVFFALSTNLQHSDDAQKASDYGDITKHGMLIQARIFPIETKINEIGHATFHHLSSARQRDIWFIADRVHLRQSFEGLVPLLALNVEGVERIRVLITKLKLEHRLLSEVAQGLPRAFGASRTCSAYTRLLRAKSRFIARILPDTLMNKQLIMAQLRKVEVHSAEKVTVEWSVKPDNAHHMIMGRSDSGRVKLTVVKDILKVILRENDVDAARPPLELQEEMTKFCGITNPVHVALLHWMLVEQDLNEIEDVLRRRGIPNNIPEFDCLVRDSVVGEVLSFTGLDGTPNSIDGDSQERRYQGRKRKQRVNPFSNDQNTSKAVESFIKKFDLANSFKNRINQPWQDTEPENMLSHICKLENMDPFSLLPQKNDVWHQHLRRGGGFPDDLVGIVFNDGQNTNQMDYVTKSSQTFPAIVSVSGKGHIHVEVSIAAKVNTDEETIFAGELYFSKLLEKRMGHTYVPALHWTSRLRGKAGLMPYRSNDKAQSAFTIEDRYKEFSQLLIQSGYKNASSWSNPTYHIEVNTSDEGLLSAFSLSPNQVNKARELNLQMGVGTSPNDIFILIRICNVRTDPKTSLIVDPWQLHKEGVLSLTAESHHKAQFTQIPPLIGLDTIASNFGVEQTTEKRFGRFLTRRKRASQIQTEAKEVNPNYAYKTLGLGEIRLFEMFPGSGDMPVRGSLRSSAVESAGVYSALSYVWGPALKPFEIQTAEGNIPLTGSLHSALKRIRDKDLSIVLWVDAVCINQADYHEKIVQIRLLAEVFRRAGKVYAWAGDEKDNSNRAIEALVQMRTISVKPDEWPSNLPPISSTWIGNTPALDDKIWVDIGKFFERPWFQRAWVVQELVLATNVKILCGDWDVSWDDIFAALESCLDNFNTVQQSKPPHLLRFISQAKPAYALALTRRMFNDPRMSQRFNLLSLLDMFAHTEATIGRDKLFALLGLASDAESEIFDPDYSSEIEIVISRYASEFVRRGAGLDLLYRAGLSKACDFCSWIPDWTAKEPRRTISTWRGAKGPFSAGGTSWDKPKLDKNRLKVLGAHTDVVVELSPTSTNEQDIISVVNLIHASIDKIKAYPTGETSKDLKLRVPIGNAMTPCEDDTGTLGMSIVQAKEADQVFNWAEVYSAFSSVQAMVNFLKTPQHVRERTWKYWTTAAAFAKRMSSGRFCTTQKGYIGFVPHDAEVGDKIFLIYGGVVPFVLRNTAGYDEEYKLVGESYIHGIMYGESLLSGELLTKNVFLV